MIIGRMNVRRIIQDYFTFSRSERIGVTTLLIIILLLYVTNRILFYFETPGKADIESFQQAIMSMQEHMENPPGKKRVSLFSFDPNVIDSLALDSLNLSAYIKTNLLKYRRHGGYFSRADHFRKLYGMNDSIFQRIKPYISIPEKKKSHVLRDHKIKHQSVSTGFSHKEPVKIDLNAADSLILENLPGIGYVLAKRIVKYRHLLGGFYSSDQLSEVYGLKRSVIDVVAPILTIDTTLLRKIDLNFSKKEELFRHPYLSKMQVEKIITYRNTHGFIKDIAVLRDSMILNVQDFNKLRPYLGNKESPKFVKKSK